MTEALVDRSLYPTLSGYTYLNQAALGLLSEPVVQSMHAFLDDVVRHGNLRMDDDQEVAFFESVREAGAKILGCDSDLIAITGSASELLGQLPHLIGIDGSDEIILVSTDFPALTRPWLRSQREGRCTPIFVDDDPSANLTDSLIGSISTQTAVVAVGHVQYGTGSIVDVERLREATSAVGALLIVDATQSAGAIHVDSARWNADAVISSGYKWLGGHGGVALSYVAEGLLQREPMLPGWMGTPAPFDFDAKNLGFAEDARRFTLSTMSYLSMKGLVTSIDQLLDMGIHQIEHRSKALFKELSDTVSEYGWIPFRNPDDASASPNIVSFSHPDEDVRSVFQQLEESHVICGIRDNRIRISIAPYNNSEDVERVKDVLIHG